MGEEGFELESLYMVGKDDKPVKWDRLKTATFVEIKEDGARYDPVSIFFSGSDSCTFQIESSSFTKSMLKWLKRDRNRYFRWVRTVKRKREKMRRAKLKAGLAQ